MYGKLDVGLNCKSLRLKEIHLREDNGASIRGGSDCQYVISDTVFIQRWQKGQAMH